MVLVNKRGGAGAISLNYLKSRPRDGHTLMTTTPTHLFTMARGRSTIGIDDLVGIARAADDPQIIMVHSDSPYQTIEELIGASKIKGLKWGITQIGSIDHVTAYTFSRKTGIRLDVVPFRGGGDVLTNLLGRNVQVVLLNLGEAEIQIQSGQVRPLLVLAKERMKRLPDVPTSIEKGIDAVFSVIRGFVVLKGVPQGRVERLEQSILAAMGGAEYQEHLRASGLDSGSIADRKEWEAQFRKLYRDGLESLRELGFVR
jgi:tripartite-type tricarboxylate transporter receptor subunit TctC